ncbi:MAG TPA: hypothetical protein VD790_02120 [Thermoleophilaceae bacterium]|nr:hypothetical protein [Thermoleophilaceae bacterium]
MAERRFTDEELDDALRALTEPERFREAEARVARVAPQLQHVLYQALDLDGYFGQLRESEVASAMKQEDLAERTRAVRTLLAEETRLGMLIGVAVGWELARELELEEKEE